MKNQLKNEDMTREQILDELAKLQQKTADLEKSKTLRKHAGRALKHQMDDLQNLSPEDVLRIVHELQVHQIELEMQNEELRRAQNELEESRNRYSNLYDFAPVGYFTFDRNGQILEVNLTGANLLGIERMYLIKKPFSSYISFRSRDVFYLHLRKVFGTKTRQICEIKLVDKNKNNFYIQLESLAVQDSEVSQCRTVIVNITELKRAEEKLLKAHDELLISNAALQAEIIERRKAQKAEYDAHIYAESIVETLRESLIVLDPQLRVVIANQTFYKTFKVSLEETMDRYIYDLGNRQWDIPELRKLLEGIVQENTHFYDFEVDHEFPKIGRRTMLLNARRIYPEGKETERVLLAIEDITEKKMLEAQLLHSQRMESIGTLAGGIAHDINNLLTPMMLSLQMLKERYTDEQSQKLLTILENNSWRGANLIKQVVSFARGVDGEKKPLNMKHIIDEIEKIVIETFPKDIEFKKDIPDDLRTISGDVTQMHQVIMNLCVNARDAMPLGGVLRVTASNFFVDKNHARMHADAKAGSYIQITVSDTGTGIAPEIIDRIFEPFFTTKEHGTGLGLSTAFAIVKSHGGFIDVQTEVGKGAVFKVHLPASSRIEKQKIEPLSVEHIQGDGETILIVDDEAPIRETTCAVLEKYGYKTIAACNGVEAISQYINYKNEIELVLMDMAMPFMDGPACIHALRKIDPDVKIIAVSGLIDGKVLSKVENSAITVLRKPYTAEILLENIHKAKKEKPAI